MSAFLVDRAVERGVVKQISRSHLQRILQAGDMSFFMIGRGVLCSQRAASYIRHSELGQSASRNGMAHMADRTLARGGCVSTMAPAGDRSDSR